MELGDVLQFIGAASAKAPPAPLTSMVSESSKIANHRPVELARMQTFYLSPFAIQRRGG